MSNYAGITDPSNPFATAGLSHEVRSMLDYLLCAKEAGLDVVATSTTDHAAKTSAGWPSRHRMAGTDGEGLAIDCRLRKRGDDIHRAVFDIFVPVEGKLHELIYAGAPYNIKAGKRVAPYAVASHHDHVHLSVARGTMLRWPGLRSTPKEATMAFALDGTAAVQPLRRDPQGRLAFWGWRKDGSVFAFNGAPGPVPSAAAKSHIGTVTALLPDNDGGYFLVGGEPGANSTWSTYRSSEFPVEWRG